MFTNCQVLVYNSYFYPTLERMKKLRHVVLHGVCDNQTLSIMGQNCNVLQFLDLTGTHIFCFRIKNLVDLIFLILTKQNERTDPEKCFCSN